MTKAPNNFPREGGHSPVTVDRLKALEKNRPTPQHGVNYTIGGVVEAAVHTTVEAERNYALTSGYKRLQTASDKSQTDHVFAANEGRAKAQFQKTAQLQKAYVDMQRVRAKKAKRHDPAHDR